LCEYLELGTQIIMHPLLLINSVQGREFPREYSQFRWWVPSIRSRNNWGLVYSNGTKHLYPNRVLMYTVCLSPLIQSILWAIGHASKPYRKQLPPQQTVGGNGRVRNQCTPSKETLLPAHIYRVQFRAIEEYFNCTRQLVDSEEEGRSSTMDRQWLKRMKD